jgi:protein-tyrosine-phosphatase
MPADDYILFVDDDNTCLSPLAAGVFNQTCTNPQYEARSAGVATTGKPIDKMIVDALMEIDAPTAELEPIKLTPQMADKAFMIISLGPQDFANDPVLKGREVTHWRFERPKPDMASVRQVRDRIKMRVNSFVSKL